MDLTFFVFVFARVSALIFLHRNAKSAVLIRSSGGAFVGQYHTVRVRTRFIIRRVA